MSIDTLETLAGNATTEYAASFRANLDEARRQLEICNACRYCEGYCSVFPSMTQFREFSDGDVTQLANLCHNCRGCYYACQYTAPHEFDLNLPKALAEVRVDSWEHFIQPSGLSSLMQKSGTALVGALVAGLAAILAIAYGIKPESGEGFYAYISHNVLATVFSVAFVLPLFIIAIGVRSYWKHVGGQPLTINQIRSALIDAGRLKNLSGGAAEGCNYEKENRFSMTRRYAHQAVMWGFLLCFAATASGTIMHYVFDMKAPYGLFSLPKLFGVPGGILLTLGGLEMIRLKMRAEKSLGAPAVWGGEMAFVVLLTAVAATGLALYAATGTAGVQPLLIVHLATVLALFLTLPYTKMAHIPFRLAALLRDAQRK